MDLTEGSLTDLLPTELCVEILKNLDIKDVLAMSLTCHKWNDIVNNTDILWKHLAETHCFQLSKCEAADKSKPVWKDIFKNSYGRQGTKNLWKSGHFSHIQCVEQLYPHKMYALSANDWENIFELELSR